MTSQQENYIKSRLEAYREELEDKAVDWIERKVENALEETEEKEGVRAFEELNLRGAAYDAHMKKFLEDTKSELEEYFKAESDEENNMWKNTVRNLKMKLNEIIESTDWYDYNKLTYYITHVTI